MSETENPQVAPQGDNPAVTMPEKLSGQQLAQMDIGEIGKFIDEIAAARDPKDSALDFYKKAASRFPLHISQAKQDEALEAISSKNSSVADEGRKVLLFLRLHTVIKAVEPYLGDNKFTNEELAQAAVVRVTERVGEIKPEDPQVAARIHHFARRGAAEVIAAQENIPADWVFGQWPHPVKVWVDEIIENEPSVLRDANKRKFLVELLERRTAISAREIGKYIEYRIALAQKDGWLGRGEVDDVENVSAEATNKVALATDKVVLRQALEGETPLTQRERKIIKMRYGLSPEERDYTLEEVGKGFGVTRNRIRQIEARVFRKLRRYLE